MSQMVRKQVYLEKKQDRLLKRLAEARGVSEAEVVRRAIEREADTPGKQPAPGDPEAIEAVIRYALKRRGSAGPSRPHVWRREDAYEERESRYERGSGERP